MEPLLLWLIGIVPSLVSAQPMNPEPSVEIRPISDIYTDGPPEITNITDSHATLAFISSIPVACSVVYGTDETYGMIAQDRNMNGGAITDHFPSLADLEPSTEYHYRVQGSDANGILYVSEPMTFTTPAAATDSPINLAALSEGAQVVAVSSNFGGAANDGSWGANSAIDENPSTAWSSSGDGNDAFIEIELAEAANVSEIAVWTRFMSNNTAKISSFTLTGKTEMGEEKEVGPFTLPDADQAYPFEVDFGDMAIKVVRLDVVESNGGNTGLVEFAVYGGEELAVSALSSQEYVYLPLINNTLFQ